MINANTLIVELIKSIASTATVLKVLQKANTVVVDEECITDFVTAINNLFATINKRAGE